MGQDFEKGFVCEHCESYVKQYTRSFNANMALCILLLYRFNVRGFIKVEDFLIKNGQKRCGDFSYLIHYKFLERQEGKREDGSKRTGYYRLTSLGILFAEGKIGAKRKFVILHNKLMGFEGDDIYIKEALGKKFSYEELMKDARTEKSLMSNHEYNTRMNNF
jgi:hypothetical protein